MIKEAVIFYYMKVITVYQAPFLLCNCSLEYIIENQVFFNCIMRNVIFLMGNWYVSLETITFSKKKEETCAQSSDWSPSDLIYIWLKSGKHGKRLTKADIPEFLAFFQFL